MSTRGRSWVPSGRASPWECRAAQYRQVRPEEAQEPSWGTAKGALFERAGVREGALHRAHDLARVRVRVRARVRARARARARVRARITVGVRVRVRVGVRVRVRVSTTLRV